MAPGYLAFMTTVMIIFSVGLIGGSMYLFKTVKRSFVKHRLKKIDLNKYEIIVDNKGFPTLLVGVKDRNDLVYL